MGVIVLGTRSVPRRLETWSRALVGSAPSQSEHVVRRERPYWQERGWVRHGDTYEGAYQTPRGSFRGLIEVRGAGYVQFYLRDVPPALPQSSHWACFQPRGDKGFLVHMSTRPTDISSGILTIERLLTECGEPTQNRSILDDISQTWHDIITAR